MAHPSSRIKFHLSRLLPKSIAVPTFELYKKLSIPYYKVSHSIPVWELRNVGRALHFANFKDEPMRMKQAYLIDNLNQEGKVETSVDELGGNFEAMKAYVDKLTPQGSPNAHKPFLEKLTATPALIEASNPIVQFALSEPVLQIVSHYLQKVPLLRHYDVMRTNPIGDGPRLTSQNWHRDHDDRTLVKMFIYFNDIEEENGPFCYMRRSHSKGFMRDFIPQKFPIGASATEADVEGLEYLITKCAGPAGSVIFADTAGFHMGGYTREGSRVMATITYALPTHLWIPEIRFEKNFKKKIQLGAYGKLAV